MISNPRILPARKDIQLNTLQVLKSPEYSDYEDDFEVNQEPVKDTQAKIRHAIQSKGMKINELTLVKPPVDLQMMIDKMLKDNKRKDAEIMALRKELLGIMKLIAEDKNTNEMLNFSNDDPKSDRIRELAKKCRRLTVAYEKLRSQNMVLTTQSETRPTKIPTPQKQPIETNPVELKSLRDKLAHASRKLEDERNHNRSLKVEIRQLQKVISQEVGEGYSIEKV